MNDPIKKLCRLCYYETSDMIEIFSDKGLEQDCKGKINKYLYLKVQRDDCQPKTVCWMCSQHLETFHKFYEKINEIQKSILKEDYDYVVLRPEYKNQEIIDIAEDSQNNTVEVLVINTSDENQYEQIDLNLLPGNNNLIKHSNYSEIDCEEEIAIEAEIEPDDIIEQFELSEEVTVQQNDHIFLERNNQKIKSEYHDNNVASLTASTITSNSSLLSDRNKIINANESIVQTIKGLSEDSVTNTYENILSNHFVKTEITNECDLKKSHPKSPKRKRGRPKKIENKKCEIQEPTKFYACVNNAAENIEQQISNAINQKTSRSKSAGKITTTNIDIEEGESDNEFPARDSDNEDWPAQATLNEFPEKILLDGYLLVKGKRLLTMISKYYKLDCDLCRDKPRFKQLKDLFNHYTDAHKQEGYVICCQTKLSRYPAIIMHMARHLQPDAFKCDECGYMVTRPRFLNSHKQTHLPQNLKPFKCDQCDRRFCWKGALQIHLISHQKPEERKLYICHICGKVYDTPGGLSTHKKQIHSEKKPISNVCHVCAKKFATRTGLNEHMATIHQPREKDQVQCIECGKWLMNQRCLKSHMILHSNTTYNCHICPYETKKKVLLKRHLLTQHSDEKPYQCEPCKKSFKLKRALTVHIAQHNSSKSYKCTFCDRQFNSSTNFYTHRKNMHPVELQRMKEEILEKQRQKRIMAGIESAANKQTPEMNITKKSYEKSNQVSSGKRAIIKHVGMYKPKRKIIQFEKQKNLLVGGTDADSEVSIISNDKLTEDNDIDILITKEEEEEEECEIMSIQSEDDHSDSNNHTQILTIIPVNSENQPLFIHTPNEPTAVAARKKLIACTKSTSNRYQ